MNIDLENEFLIAQRIILLRIASSSMYWRYDYFKPMMLLIFQFIILFIKPNTLNDLTWNYALFVPLISRYLNLFI